MRWNYHGRRKYMMFKVVGIVLDFALVFPPTLPIGCCNAQSAFFVWLGTRTLLSFII